VGGGHSANALTAGTQVARPLTAGTQLASSATRMPGSGSVAACGLVIALTS